MSQPPSSLRPFVIRALAVLLLICGVHLASSAETQKTTAEVLLFRYPMPLGADAYTLEPIKRTFFLLACADNPEFNSIRVTRAHLGGSVVTPDGSEMRHYPDELNFRVTASALEPEMLTSDVESVNYLGEMNDFLLGLRFRLKIYRGLKMTIIDPSRVHLMGVPADLPYEERIYRVSFDTTDIPVDARLVLEVFGPNGERLSRFHLELL